MQSLRSRLRHILSSQSLGIRRSTLHQWTWKLLMCFPFIRAIVSAKQGAIIEPLQYLERSRFQFAEIAQLRDRLDDMAKFMRVEGHDAAVVSNGRGSFNGKVLFALHSCGAFHPSGYASRSMSIIKALDRAGVRSTIVVRPGYPWDLGTGAPPKTNKIEFEGLMFHLSPDADMTLRSPESSYIAYYADVLSQKALDENVSVIHAASNYLNGYAAAHAARRLGITSIYEVRGLWHLTRAFSSRTYEHSDHYRYCEKREIGACLSVDRVVTLSDGLKSWLIEHGVPESKIFVVGNAASVTESKQLGSDVRQRYGIPVSAKVVGYLGAFVPYEGLDLLLRAQAQTPRDRRPYLLLIGSGTQEEELRQLTKTLDLEDSVVFGGRAAPHEVSSFYQAMDLVALPRKDDLLTRLVPALKPFEVAAHKRRLIISRPLCIALGSTLKTGYSVVNFEQLDSLETLFNVVEEREGYVPTWDDRADEIVSVYRAP